MSSESVKPQILCIGFDDGLTKLLSSALQHATVLELPYDVDRICEQTGVEPGLILCGQPGEGVNIIEIAQVLRMQFQAAQLYAVFNSGAKVDRVSVVKNGFTDAFFRPVDEKMLIDSVRGFIRRVAKIGTQFRSVKMVDLRDDTVLDFDTYLYLPANNRHLKYSSAGREMGAEKIQKLKSHQVNSVFISEEDMPKFHHYVAESLKRLGKSGTMSETERLAALQTAIRDVVTGLFSDTLTDTGAGRRVAEDCQKIVRNYIVPDASSKTSFYDRIMMTTGSEAGTYSHAGNVSTFAALFAIGLGVAGVQDIALAGLLHDIGLSKVPSEIQEKTHAERTLKEREIYAKHIEFAIEMIKERRLIVPELTVKIISQHHERFDGTGYPKGLAGDRLPIESQILIFADTFDEMTSVTPSRPAMTARAAIESFRQMLGNPSRSLIDPMLLRRLIALFPDTRASS